MLAQSTSHARPRYRAERARGVITVDGRLDEPDWQSAPVASGFSSYEPRSDLPAQYNSPAATFDLRPEWRPPGVRAFTPRVITHFYHRVSDADFVEGDVAADLVAVTFTSSDTLTLGLTPTWQRLEAPFEVVPGATVAAGAYQHVRWRAAIRSDASRAYGGALTIDGGGFYDGERTRAVAALELRPSPRAALTASCEANRLRRLGGLPSATDHLLVAEARLAWSPRLQIVGVVQRDTLAGRTALNLRLAWELAPLSFFYLVYTDDRDDVGAGLAAHRWQLTAKLTYLLQR